MPTVHHDIAEQLYTYRARISTETDRDPIYDADTLRLDIDLGFGIWKHAEVVRLARIDAWEVRGSERTRGLAARDFVRDHLPPGTAVLIETIKDARGKYGRYLAEIHLGDGTLLSDVLVEKGHAEYQSYD